MGTPPNHFAAVIFWWHDENGELMTIVVDSTPTNKDYPDQEKQTKIPGGMGKDGETCWDTARREAGLEETWLEIVCMLSTPDPFYAETKGRHTKVAYLVPIDCCTGKLRDVPLVENDSILDPPRIIPMEQAITEAYFTEYNGFHRHAFIEAWKRLNREPATLVAAGPMRVIS